MAETTMEPWSFTIVFDEDKAKKNGYEVDSDGKERAGVFGNRHAVFGGFSLEGFLLVFSHPHLDACFFSPHVAFGTSRFSRIIRLQIAPPRLQTVRNRAAGLPPTENRQL